MDLKKCPTLVDPVYDSKKEYHEQLRRQVKALSLLQRLHYCPWYVIPADDKKNARLIVSELVIGAFDELKMSYPEPSVKRAEELAAIRKALVE